MLPAGWTLEHSRTHGRPYYYHAETGKVTWELPFSSHSVDQLQHEQTPSSIVASSTSQVSVTIGQELCEHAESSSKSSSNVSRKSFSSKGDNFEDLSSTGKSSFDGLASTKSPGSVPRASSSISGEGGSTKSPESAERSHSPRSQRSFNSAAESPVEVEEGESTILGVPIRVLQLVEEFTRYRDTANCIDQLKLVISDMELERWALEAALEIEDEHRPALERQLAFLNLKFLAKNTALGEALRKLAESEALLVKAVKAKRLPASSPGSQSSRSDQSRGSSRSVRSKASHNKVCFSGEACDAERIASARVQAEGLSTEFFKLQGQLSTLDAQLDGQLHEALALASSVGGGNTVEFGMGLSCLCDNGEV